MPIGVLGTGGVGRTLASALVRLGHERRLGSSANTRTVSVYGMRMARANITVPDDLLDRARAAGLNVSRIAASALSEELDRRDKIAALDSYLEELDAALGPIPRDEDEAARQWADRMLGEASQPMSAPTNRTA